jgi:tetratricopeptide (TPR) repeat protein
MKKAIGILIVLVFSLLYYMGALTKKETLPLSKEFFSIETSPYSDRPLDFKGIWVLKSQAIDPKASFKNPKELDQLYQLKLDKGIKNLPLLSFMLIREAKQAREQGDADQAIGLASYAIKFSPDLPQSHFELARSYWSQNPFQLHKILPEFFRGRMAQFRHYPSSLILFYNLFYILSSAILMTFIVFGIVIMVKYLPLYFYDIRRNLTHEISALLINGAKIFVLFLPFFLRLDILWAILFWSILLWGFVVKKERKFILIFLIILVYLPFFLRFNASFLDGPASDVILEINQANHEDWDKTNEQKLEAWLSTHPDDAEVLFTLGLIQKREGRYVQAEELYQRATQQNQRFSEALSNLGNVYLAKKQPNLAIDYYQKAVGLKPNKGAYYYNLYRAHAQETFLSRKIDKAFEKARQLDPKLVDYYSTIDSPNMNRLVIDEVLATSKLWRRFLTQYIGREGPLYRLFNAWFEKIPSRTFLVPVLFLGFLIGMSRYSRAKRFFTRCPMCGSPTYRFYLGASDEEPDQELICFNCHRIFVQKEKLHPKITEKKSLQVRQFQKQNNFISKFLSFFFVGFGDLWKEHSLKGLFFLFIFFIFILRFIYWNGVMTLFNTQSSMTFWRWIFWGGLLVVFYYFSLRRVYRFKPRFEIEP